MRPEDHITRYPDLAGKVAVVTGAGEGIGYAICEALVDHGARVVLNDLDGELCRRAAHALDAQGPGRCVPCAGDCSDVGVIDVMIQLATDRFGGVDLVVPNAGITMFGRFLDFDADSFDRLMGVNLRGGYFLAQRAARVMRDQRRRGAIVLMSSNVGLQAYPQLTAYSMSKAALQMMARSLVQELAPLGIRVNAIAPGATLTERTKYEQEDYAGIWAELIPRGQIAQPEDIADATLFLLSDASRHVLGHTLVVDGGWTATSPLPAEAHSGQVLTADAAGVSKG